MVSESRPFIRQAPLGSRIKRDSASKAGLSGEPGIQLPNKAGAKGHQMNGGAAQELGEGRRGEHTSNRVEAGGGGRGGGVDACGELNALS